MTCSTLGAAQVLLIMILHPGVDPGLVSKDGHVYSLEVTSREERFPLFELRRRSPSGDVPVLWQSPRQPEEILPGLFAGSLSLSPVWDLYEENGEISLLVFDGASDGLVFKFSPTAPQANPVRIRSLRNGMSDPVGRLRFKHHGELYFDVEKVPDSAEKNVIRFARDGHKTYDFRDPERYRPDRPTIVISNGSGFRIVNGPVKPDVESPAPLDRSTVAPDRPSPSPTLEAPKRDSAFPDATSAPSRPAPAQDSWIVLSIGLAAVGLAAIWLRGRRDR